MAGTVAGAAVAQFVIKPLVEPPLWLEMIALVLMIGVGAVVGRLVGGLLFRSSSGATHDPPPPHLTRRGSRLGTARPAPARRGSGRELTGRPFARPRTARRSTPSRRHRRAGGGSKVCGFRPNRYMVSKVKRAHLGRD
jgi:hypothetical protein